MRDMLTRIHIGKQSGDSVLILMKVAAWSVIKTYTERSSTHTTFSIRE